MMNQPANSEPNAAADSSDRPPAPRPAGLSAVLANYPWLTYVLPIATFMIVGNFEPTPDSSFELFGFAIPYDAYPLVYAAKIALTMAAMAVVWPGYKQFPCRISLLAVAVGVVGGFVYVGLCKAHLERILLAPVGLEWLVDYGRRSAFNPWEHWPQNPPFAYGFLALRFWGLVAIVPIIEEFFLRGLVMRYFIAPDWWKIPFGTLTPLAVVIGTLVPVLMHPPSEALAAAAWFSLITWLMYKTRNIWDCVLAHSLTNLLLGLYVLASGEWEFL